MASVWQRDAAMAWREGKVALAQKLRLQTCFEVEAMTRCNASLRAETLFSRCTILHSIARAIAAAGASSKCG